MKEFVVSTTTKQKPAGILVYSKSGLGKTTMIGDFIKNAKNGLLFQCGEDGLSDLDPRWTEGIQHYSEVLGTGRTMDELADSWEEFKDILKNLYLEYDKYNFTHIGFDSFDNLINHALDAYVVRKFYRGDYEKANGWGGAKLKEMKDELAVIISTFELFQKNKGVSIFVTMHAQTINFRDPSVPDFKKWSLAVPAREDYNLRDMLINWSSITMFGTIDVDVEGKKATGNRHVLKTIVDASYDAKSRYSIPETIDFTYDSFKNALTNSKKEG